MPEHRDTSEQSRRRVAVGHAGAVMLLDVASGRVLWERDLAKLPAGQPCEGQPVSVRIVEEIVIAASMGHVFAFAAEDGTLLWQVNRRGRGAGETSLATDRD